VIGTVALIGLVIATGLAYTIITSYIEADVTKQQLNQIAEHVALNLVKIVSLVKFANYLNNEPMMKVLKLPSDLGGKAYVIKLMNGTISGQGCYVYTQLVTREDIAASSPILLNSTQTRLKLKTEGDARPLTYPLPVRGGNEGIIQWSSTVYGGERAGADIVVWGLTLDIDTTWAGIGVWKPQGGG